jgi:hypothetical protein
MAQATAPVLDSTRRDFITLIGGVVVVVADCGSRVASGDTGDPVPQ